MTTAVAPSPLWLSSSQKDPMSGSWPPKFSFCATPTAPPRSKTPRRAAGDDAMSGILASPLARSSTQTRSTSKPIYNRPSRAKVLVASTPTNLWRQVPSIETKEKGTESVAAPLVATCKDAPVGSGRIRSSSLDPAHPPPSPRPTARPLPLCIQPTIVLEEADNYTPIVPRHSILAPRPSTPEPPEEQDFGPVLSISATPTLLLASPAPASVLYQWNKQEQQFLRLWHGQKQHNPHLPLIPSPLNPLREAMPPFYWRSVVPSISAGGAGGGARVGWNIKRPLPSPTLRTKLHSRRDCDIAGEHLSARQFFSGKLRNHCRVCAKDSLHKRVLLFNYWIERADAVFEEALGLVREEVEVIDVEMVEWTPGTEEEIPKCVLLRDRDDFDDVDEDGSPRAMEEDPLIIERHPECHTLRLF
ncbi:hypothetical protein MKEN_00350900 [Mycena kentingensis (nom. inval.)]|nr:hypothetical protein MKEN_00350900 [Mycena kentingensis (nom. inval.)]